MSDYDNTNKGVLFRNEDKQEDRHADYRGSINVDGKEFWLDAWLRKSKQGKTFMSLRVKPKMAREHQGGSRNPPSPGSRDGGDPYSDDSEIPF